MNQSNHHQQTRPAPAPDQPTNQPTNQPPNASSSIIRAPAGQPGLLDATFLHMHHVPARLNESRHPIIGPDLHCIDNQTSAVLPLLPLVRHTCQLGDPSACPDTEGAWNLAHREPSRQAQFPKLFTSSKSSPRERHASPAQTECH